jgi:hypothetical protein
MAEKKNAKYVITTYKKGLKLPEYRSPADPSIIKKVVYLDKDVVPDSNFYCEVMWLVPGEKWKTAPKQVDEHTHTWGEFMGFFGFNYENIHDLGAEIEFWIDGEKKVITESFAAFIPAGVKHGPLIVRNVRIPIFHFSSGPTPKYT